MLIINDQKLFLANAALLIGTTRFTLRRWVRQGRIAHYRCGRRIVFSRADLEQFLEAHRVSAAEPAV